METIKKDINKRINLLREQRKKLREVLVMPILSTKNWKVEEAVTRSKLLCIGYELSFLSKLLGKIGD